MSAEDDTTKSILSAFMPEYYLEKYGDLRAAFGSNHVAAWQHYVEHGIREMRSANPFFDPQYYKSVNPDLSHLDGHGLLDHWIRHGILEGRRGCFAFWTKHYLKSHPDLVAAFGNSIGRAFVHWKDVGNNEARTTSPDGIMRLGANHQEGEKWQLRAATGTRQDDPELFEPWNTTGGRIGSGVGLAVGTFYGGPAGGTAGAASGMLIGHGLDRVVTNISNDVTGPLWRSIERGPIGEVLGGIFGGGGGIQLPW